MLKRVSQLIARLRHHNADPATSTLRMAERIQDRKVDLPWERWFTHLGVQIARKEGMWKLESAVVVDHAAVASEMKALVYVLSHTPQDFQEHKYRALLDICDVYYLGRNAENTFFQWMCTAIVERPTLLLDVLNKSISRTAFLTRLMNAVKLPPQVVKSLLPEVYVFFISGWREMKRHQPPQQDMLSRRRHMQTVSRLMHPFASELGFDIRVPEPYENESERDYGMRVAQLLFPDTIQTPALPSDFTL